ncbi:SDR family NAD(P)-dependent oxidoreductase [Pseudonocardia spirodelae]|uniref:SDR family NAD(P)-dependent oxidoreductase n=1 Tax=Pseudonocardia spirodelae TaxID=3133431 RepID=A0ABU8T3Q3_9PSEU
MLFRSTTDRSRPAVPAVPPVAVAGAGTAATTAADVLAGVDLTGRRAVVTGATCGVGLAAARALAAAGAEVTLAVRDLDAGAAARDGIVADTGNEHVAVGELDLADQRSVARFVRLWDGPLHMLVHAAAVAGAPLTRTVDDWELHLAVNHLGPASLTSGLHWALTAVDGARVVTVSSAAHLDAAFDAEDPHFAGGRYDAHLAHARSRTAALLHAVETARRWSSDGIAVNAVNPGPSGRDPEQGAATVVLAAASPLVGGISGRYFEDLAEAGTAGAGATRGVAAHALDPVAARRVHRWTERTLREVWFAGLPIVA